MKKWFLAISLVLLVATLVLTACGPKQTPEPVSTEPTPTVPVQYRPPILNFTGGPPATFDPHMSTDAGSAAYINEIFSGLVTLVLKEDVTLSDGTVHSVYPTDELFWELYPKVKEIATKDVLGIKVDPMWTISLDGKNYSINLRNDVVLTMEIVPDIAHSWEISEDGTVYTFHLRDDVYFHNGRPVTAKDFKYSIERACSVNDIRIGGKRWSSPTADTYLGPILGCRAKLNGKVDEVAGVEVIDDYTLRLTIDAPRHYFLAMLTYPTAFVLCKENTESDKATEPWTDHPIGTGPFRLAEYDLRKKIVLAKNIYYYGEPKPQLQKVIVDLAGGSAIIRYENDELDLSGVGLQDLDRVKDPNDPFNKELTIVSELSTFYTAFNVEKAPFDDPRVRRAFIMAVDREKIIKKVLLDVHVFAKGILPPDMPGYDPNVQAIPFDPEGARQLLAEAVAEHRLDWGVGIEGRSGQDGFTVLEVIKDSPAKRVGLKPGDIITAIIDPYKKETGLKGLSADQIAALIPVEEDTPLTLVVERSGEVEPLKLTIKVKRLPYISLTVTGGGGAPAPTRAAMLEDWRENLGIEVILDQMPWITFLQEFHKRSHCSGTATSCRDYSDKTSCESQDGCRWIPRPFQIFSMGWIADYPDPQNFLDILFHGESLDNHTGYNNPEVNQLLDEAATETNETKRIELYREVERIIVRDAVWLTFIHGRSYSLVKPWVKGFTHPPTVISRFKYVRIEGSR